MSADLFEIHDTDFLVYELGVLRSKISKEVIDIHTEQDMKQVESPQTKASFAVVNANALQRSTNLNMSRPHPVTSV